MTFHARQIADERDRVKLAQRFGQEVQGIESIARFAAMAPRHDVRPARKMIRTRMAGIESSMRSLGRIAHGPGNYALGRGHLAMKSWDEARKHLEAALAEGFREPEVSYALGLVLGELYQRKLHEVALILDKAQREEARSQAQKTYRDPALDCLRAAAAGRGGVPRLPRRAARFLRGLRRRSAPSREDGVRGRPWLYEAKRLEGEIYTSMAEKETVRGAYDSATELFGTAERALESAAVVASSDADVYKRLALVAGSRIVLEIYHRGLGVDSHLRKGLEALDKALFLDPALAHHPSLSPPNRRTSTGTSRGAKVVEVKRDMIGNSPLLARTRQALVAWFLLSCPCPAPAVVELPTGFALKQVGYGPFFFLNDPIAFDTFPDGRLLMIERQGGVRINPDGAASSTEIHAIPDVEWAAIERGLLGLAIDPQWPVRPYVYFYFTHTSGQARLIMMEGTGDLTDPSSANLALSNEFLLLTDIPDTTEIHQGGTLRFGPDGMLYLSIGDDGWGCRSQDLTSLSGKILRLNVSAMPGAGSGPPPKADLTPADNPFPGPDENERLVYAWGVRNPFRFTIDSETGDLFLGDVGGSLFEEMNRIAAPGAGENFGWPQREGPDSTGNPFDCGIGNTFTDPIYAYTNALGLNSVIGGPLYRAAIGATFEFPPSYDGSLFFAEFFEGWIRRLVRKGAQWAIAAPVAGQPSPENWASGLYSMSDFQVGADGALYLCHFFDDGGFEPGVYRIAPTGSTGVEAWSSLTGRARAFPNPARASSGTTVRWQGSRLGTHELTFFDARGRLVHVLRGYASGASGSLHWDGSAGSGPAATGVYFYRLEDASGVRAEGKVSLIR
jgi:glucose/arabinose dehydrogenase